MIFVLILFWLLLLVLLGLIGVYLPIGVIIGSLAFLYSVQSLLICIIIDIMPPVFLWDVV